MIQLITIFFLISAIGTLTESIGINNYLQLITDVRKYYKTSCVIFVQSGNYQDLNMTTLMHTWSREFSRRGVMTVTITFLELISQYREYRKIVRPMFVILLDTKEIMNEFINATKRINPISFPVWFVIFFQRPGNPLEQYCKHPTDNIFNVDFDTVMLVLCYDYPILSEWYTVHDNRTRIFNLATWTPVTGLVLKTREALFARRSDLFGHIMHIASVEESPFIFLENNEVKGYLGSLLMELKKTMNFTVKMLKPMPAYGSWNVQNNTWTGVIGQLINKKADIGVSEFTMTTQRLNVLDFTLPLLYSRNRLYFKQPDVSNVQWSGYFQAFSIGIWAVVLTIIVIFPILLTVMKARGETISMILLSEYYIDVWGIYCQQGLSEFPKESPVRLAIFSIFVSSLVILAAYSAALISYLTVTTANLPFSTLEDYAEDGSYKLIVMRNSAEYDMFNTAEDPVLIKMNKLMKEKSLLPFLAPDGFEQTCKEKLAFYVSEVLKDAANVYLPCKVVYIESGRADSMALALWKGSPYTSAINYNIRRFMSNGVLSRLKYNYLMKNLNPPETTYAAVSLWGIAPILAVLAGGIVLAIFILIIEKTYYVFNKRFKNNKLFVKRYNGQFSRKSHNLRLKKIIKEKNINQGFHNTKKPLILPRYYP